MKIFFDDSNNFKYSNYFVTHRGELIDLLKPFVGKDNNFTDDERIKIYGLSEKDFTFIDKLEESDLAVLPWSWNYYYKLKIIDNAIKFVENAFNEGKTVISWTSGDYGVRVPFFKNLVVLRPSGYRSKLPYTHQGLPVFISDPLIDYYKCREVFLREKSVVPVIGFCGQAIGNSFKYTKDVAKTLKKNIQYFLGLSPEEPQTLYPSTRLRSKTLGLLESDNRLETNFIKRAKYRAGASTNEERMKTTREYFDNMLNSDYIVCVRGGGNFSVRLYETLAMGRIPIFVNTDCLLPLADEVDWKKHVVWVDKTDLSKIGDIVLEFHNQLSPDEFIDLQLKNRKLWEDRLRLGNFFKNFIHSNIKSIIR
ncbi:exostosin domain-containing protein [Thermaurantimonas aggregans]|uniref:exostosin domain-containing protein n=1 Tax=Thermaurantimonas aggregans TaxID=2173829 RepID=UPI0023F11CEA|nr:exostosin family protein [Thermaurantimonas aggregans]MCX8148585.1 glycosyltransferase family 47 protein [Thermaurantimonas aggregans]